MTMTRMQLGQQPLTRLLIPCALIVLQAMACGSSQAATAPVPTVRPTLEAARTITLGDVDPDPGKKIKSFAPLAEYLAEHLKEFGIREGRVAIARDIEQMADLVRRGAVDVYFDSPFPSLAVGKLAGSEVILRRWKDGDAEYWSIYVALADKGIASVNDLLGKVMAFEEPHSTSGFVLPAGTLLQRGIGLTEVARPDAPVAPNEVGYLFSKDGTNTVDLVLSPNPPKDTDGRREDSGRGWVRELQGRWPGVLG